MYIRPAAKAFALTLSLIFSAGFAGATTYNFDGVTANSATNVATGQSQLLLDVTDSGSGTVAFRFSNTGPLASSITDVYWDDQSGALGAMGPISVSAGVAFSQGANPGNLPGGSTIGFSVSPTGASADSNSGRPGVMANGVNPGEWLTIIWTLVAGVSFNDVIAALDLGGDQSGSLRVGIHVQGFSNGGSESFVNTTPAPVPVPAAGLLLAGAIGALALSRRRYRTRSRRI